MSDISLPKSRKGISYWALGIVAAILIGGSLINFLWTGNAIYAPPLAFDRKVWDDSSRMDETPTPRLRMVLDLELRYLKPGMTRIETRRLLGNDPGTVSSHEPDTEHTQNAYDVGRLNSTRMDGSLLVLQFDTQDHLVETYVVET